MMFHLGLIDWWFLYAVSTAQAIFTARIVCPLFNHRFLQRMQKHTINVSIDAIEFQKLTIIWFVVMENTILDKSKRFFLLIDEIGLINYMR